MANALTGRASMARTYPLAALAIVLAGAFISAAAAQETLFQSRRLTPTEYTFQIEGPGVDRAGTLFAVNFQKQRTIVMVRDGAANANPFATVPPRDENLTRQRAARS